MLSIPAYYHFFHLLQSTVNHDIELFYNSDAAVCLDTNTQPLIVTVSPVSTRNFKLRFPIFPKTFMWGVLVNFSLLTEVLSSLKIDHLYHQCLQLLLCWLLAVIVKKLLLLISISCSNTVMVVVWSTNFGEVFSSFSITGNSSFKLHISSSEETSTIFVSLLSKVSCCQNFCLFSALQNRLSSSSASKSASIENYSSGCCVIDLLCPRLLKLEKLIIWFQST